MKLRSLLSSFHSLNTEDKPQQGLLTSTSKPGDQVKTPSGVGCSVAAVRRPVAALPPARTRRASCQTPLVPPHVSAGHIINWRGGRKQNIFQLSADLIILHVSQYLEIIVLQAKIMK